MTLQFTDMALMTLRRTLVVGLGFLLVGACGPDSRRSDSTYAADLSLASQTKAEPQLKDTALSTTVNATPRRETKAPASARQTATRPQPAPAPTSTQTTPAADLPAIPAPEPVKAPPFRGIPAGASLSLTTKGAVCTTNLPGDKFTATVVSDVVGENGATIPAGTTVVLEVAEVAPGATPEQATMKVRIRSVLVNDQPVDVPSDVTVNSTLERHTEPRDKGSDRKKVVGGLIAGAIIGQVIGKNTKSTVAGAAVGAAAGAAAAAASGPKYDACLPIGSSLKATTREPVPLTGDK